MNVDKNQLLAFMSGYRIMMLRKQRGVSQASMARGIVSQPTFSLLETGKHPPEPELLRLLGERFQDDVLLNYAVSVEDSKGLLDIPPDDILTALLQYSAAWSEFHAHLAVELSQYYVSTNDLKIAEELVDLVIINKPDSSFYYQACAIKGKLLLYSYRYEQAIKVLRQALDAHHVLSPEMTARALYNLGYACFFEDKYDLATTYCAQVVALCQSTSGLFWLLAKALGLRGAIYRRIGRLDESVQDLEEARVMLDKFDGVIDDKFRVSVAIADVFECKGQFQEAEARLGLVAHFEPEFKGVSDVSKAMYYRILARVTHRQGDVVAAQAAIDTAIHFSLQADDDWSLTWSFITAISVYQDEARRFEAARRALGIAKLKELPVQGAVAAQALLQLSGEPLSTCVADTLSLYRAALQNSIYLEHVIAPLPEATVTCESDQSYHEFFS